MDATIEVAGNDARHLVDLQSWLQQDRAIGGAARLTHKPIGEHELGGAADVLEVALGSGGVGIALARVLISWLKMQRETISITVTRGREKVVVDVAHAKAGTADELLGKLLRQPDGS